MMHRMGPATLALIAAASIPTIRAGPPDALTIPACQTVNSQLEACLLQAPKTDLTHLIAFYSTCLCSPSPEKYDGPAFSCASTIYMSEGIKGDPKGAEYCAQGGSGGAIPGLPGSGGASISTGAMATGTMSSASPASGPSSSGMAPTSTSSIATSNTSAATSNTMASTTASSASASAASGASGSTSTKSGNAAPALQGGAAGFFVGQFLSFLAAVALV